MAEAQSAVAFSFGIIHDTWDVNFDREVLYQVLQLSLRSLKKKIIHFKNRVYNGVYPGHLHSLYLLWPVLVAAHFGGVRMPFGLVQKALIILPSDSLMWQMMACLLVALVMWLSIIFLMRSLLKLLLMYKGWMYESRAPGSRASLRTAAWASLMKLLSNWNKPRLYSFQDSLPSLPLPSVKDTVTKYLESVRPLLDDENYSRVEHLARDFQQTMASKLQRYLVLKSWWSRNYVGDWWREYAYLRGRSPLMVNSNFYCMDTALKLTHSPSARAGVVIHYCLQFRRLIQKQELKPIMLQGIVPLCSWQYERLFNAVRVPGTEADRLEHYGDASYVTVQHRGRYYKLPVYVRGRLLNPAEIQAQLQQILQDPAPASQGEQRLAALTAGERSHWARTREAMFQRGRNRASLHAVERAAFHVCLDDAEYGYDDESDPSELDKFGRVLLHGSGHDRWFDKSLNLCFSSNASMGYNAEHTWSDALITSHFWEYMIWSELQHGYDEAGNARGSVECRPPPPMRLLWDLPEPLLAAIDTSHRVATQLIDNLDLRVLKYTGYGKGFMKKCQVSPDSYIQMALQLAYFRAARRFSLTYEATMTRLFREGRTETVRSCTMESVAWVRAMEDPLVPLQRRVELFMRATNKHSRGYQDAMAGRGIDRHLFCLLVVSKYLGLDSPFLKEVFSEPWRLSTSQSPHGITNLVDLKKYPTCLCAGGGFGPVADDGYGVSYIVAGEDMVFFHITSKISSPQTSSSGFAEQLKGSLQDMRDMIKENNKLKNTTNTLIN